MLEHRDCAEIDEMLPAFAVDALAVEERARVEQHLLTCERHEDVQAWSSVALRLADLAPEIAPPAGLRDRIVAIGSTPAVEEPAAEDATVVAIPTDDAATAPSGSEGADAPRPAHDPIPFRQRWFPYSLAAAFAALALFFGGWTAILLGGSGGSDMMVASGSAQGIEAKAMFMETEGVAVVKIDGLTSLPAGRAYQLWAIGPDGNPVPAGMLYVEEGAAEAAVAGEFATGWTIAITVEPEGGSEAPSDAPLVAVTF